MGTDLPEDEHETIAGLVSATAGHIPSPGELIIHGEVRLIVDEGDDQQVERLWVIAPEDSDN